MTPRRSSSAVMSLVLAALALGNTGCVALLDAALKETSDHGHGARYENKNFGEHFLDSLGEDDDDCHCHGACEHRSGSRLIIIHEDC